MPQKHIEQQLAHSAVLFAALGDPTRLALLHRLAQNGPSSISPLAKQFTMTRQGVTKHLQILEGARLVDGRRQGRESVYEMKAEQLVEARRCLDLLSQGWDDALQSLKAHVEQG